MPIAGQKQARLPQLRIDPQNSYQERHATWFELFYDLAFVVIVAQLAHHFSEHLSWQGFLTFVLLFGLTWWAWIGEAYYSTRFDSDGDLVHRGLGSLQVVGLVGLAVAVERGVEAATWMFAGSYAFVRTMQVLQYLRAGYYLPQARLFTQHYAKLNVLSVIVWWVSVFLPAPLQYGAWLVAFAIEISTPLSEGSLHTQFPPHVTHIPERFGLFTTLVLGELVTEIVQGLAQNSWQFDTVMMAVLSVAIAVGLWWTYFNRLDDDAVRQLVGFGRIWIYQLWLYVHLPLAISAAIVSVGIGQVLAVDLQQILSTSDRALLLGSTAAFLIFEAVICFTTIGAGSPHPAFVYLGRVLPTRCCHNSVGAWVNRRHDWTNVYRADDNCSWGSGTWRRVEGSACKFGTRKRKERSRC
jgi:low temperature requirement protein LtrA